MAVSRIIKDIWWLWILRGIFAVLFGVAAVFWPGLTLVTLVYLFGAFVIATGITTLLGSILEMEASQSWFLLAVVALFEVGVGVYFLRHPAITFTTLVLLIGFALIVRGVVGVVRALIEETSLTAKAISIMIGLVAFVVGIFMLYQKQAAGVAFVWLLGLYAIVTGTLEIAMAMDARKVVNRLTD